MKKFLIFALLFLPVASFGASSVRVLGTGGVTPGAGTKTTTTSAAKVTPAKVTAAKPAAASTASNASNATTSRIGTIRVKPKTSTSTTLSSGTTSTTSTGSRFPVITPAQSYKTVGTQQAGSTNAGTGTVQPAAVTDDPRFDMILSGRAGKESAEEIRADWVKRVGEGLVSQRENEGYVFMWVEE